MTDEHPGRKLYKKQMTTAMDGIVMDSIGKGDFDSFKEYKSEMEDFTFDAIFGGG